MKCVAIVAFAMALSAAAVEEKTAANPIRKVVGMLQKLQKKVTEEQETEQELFKKFMCYCKNGKGDLAASIDEAEGQASALTSEITAGEQEEKQLRAAVKSAKSERSDAKQAIAEANSIRDKEAAAFSEMKASLSTDVQALGSAINALGAGTFLQTRGASTLQSVVEASETLGDEDRRLVLAFLSGGTEYAPQSGQIIGILKTMEDEMHSDLSQRIAAEKKAVQSHAALVSAKNKETSEYSKVIETKTKRAGEVAVEVQQKKNGLAQAADSAEDDKKFLADLNGNCDTKAAENADNVKNRQQELIALADTIQMLNNDDALEAFTAASGMNKGSSLIQLTSSSVSMRNRALVAIKKAKQAKAPYNAKLDLIALALHAKKGDFSKIIKMIDEMQVTLKEEQAVDDAKKDECNANLEQSADTKKGLERDIADSVTRQDDLKEKIKAAAETIAELTKTIADTDKSVAEATEERKAANAAFKQTMADNSVARGLIIKAKNRLAKFYNPALHDEKLDLVQEGEKPGPAPETAGAYKKSSEESAGIVATMDILVQDIDKETQTAEADEKNDQKLYEGMLADSAAKRAEDSDSLNEQTEAKSTMEANLQAENGAHAEAVRNHKAEVATIQALHADCDWLLQNHGYRAEARAAEVDNLKNARAVLSGADYSFLQLRRLRGGRV